MSRPRCICGRSADFPLCDGSHAGEDWACESVPSAPVAVVVPPSLRNVGLRLAAELRGRLVDAPTDLKVHRLLVLTEGSDLDWLRPIVQSLQAARVELVGVGVSASLLSEAMDAAAVHEVEAEPLASLGRRVLGALAGSTTAQPPGRWFISHASADEALLEPMAAYLREQLGLDVFLCSDSIPTGSAWQQELVRSLEGSDGVVFVLSQASRASTFCAWELGFAMASKKPLRVLRLDDTPLPAFIQHVHVQDLARLRNARPWLDEEEALLQAVLTALG